jgi:hypothetical protein
VSNPILLHWMPRVSQDVNACKNFVARQPWGKPEDRELDIRRVMREICASPERNRPELHSVESGLWLRRRKAAQFVIVYAYIRAKMQGQPNIVSIRAVKHGRVANVFHGVKEPPAQPSRSEVA